LNKPVAVTGGTDDHAIFFRVENLFVHSLPLSKDQADMEQNSVMRILQKRVPIALLSIFR
jgi:hypothetical protein